MMTDHQYAQAHGTLKDGTMLIVLLKRCFPDEDREYSIEAVAVPSPGFDDETAWSQGMAALAVLEERLEQVEGQLEFDFTPVR
jgi:hypothetical protein